MLNFSVPSLSRPGAGSRRSPRLARASARAEAALVRLARLLEAEVESRAERGHGAVETWGLLCRVEALLADLGAERAVVAAAPPDDAARAPGRAG
jgi:hypothetical protein